nr:hypothetical protein [Tanacetum cinerariifolium]
RNVEAGIDIGIGMEVDIGIDVEDEVKDEVESSDRGTMEVGVDMDAGIDIPDCMLMPNAVERLEQVKKGLQNIHDHVIEIPLQRKEDIETAQRQLEAGQLIASGESWLTTTFITSWVEKEVKTQEVGVASAIIVNYCFTFKGIVRFGTSALGIIMDPNSSIGKICLGDDVIEISSDKIKGSGDWSSLEYQDTAIRKGKKVMSALSFYRMETNEVSERYIAPCFVNDLEAFDGEVNLAFDENLVSNEFTVKL